MLVSSVVTSEDIFCYSGFNFNISLKMLFKHGFLDQFFRSVF